MELRLINLYYYQKLIQHQQLQQAHPAGLLLLLKLFKLIGAEQTILEEGVSDPFTKCFDRRHGINGRLCADSS